MTDVKVKEHLTELLKNYNQQLKGVTEFLENTTQQLSGATEHKEMVADRIEDLKEILGGMGWTEEDEETETETEGSEEETEVPAEPVETV